MRSHKAPLTLNNFQATRFEGKAPWVFWCAAICFSFTLICSILDPLPACAQPPFWPSCLRMRLTLVFFTFSSFFLKWLLLRLPVRIRVFLCPFDASLFLTSANAFWYALLPPLAKWGTKFETIFEFWIIHRANGTRACQISCRRSVPLAALSQRFSYYNIAQR